MRMARVNITVPDEVTVRARAAKLNVSRITTAALLEELNRLAKRAELDAYLAELEAERGPITKERAAGGRAWLDAALLGVAQALILTSDPDDLAAQCESEIKFAPM
jgi:post-segregation antitoxin (ccd killing protein)